MQEKRDLRDTEDHLSPPGRAAITRLLLASRDGRADAMDALLPLLYDELHALAQKKLRYERANHTLNTTALVHEAYLKLVDQRQVDWQDRTHFFAVAALAMRRILVDYADRRNAKKRGGGAVVFSLDEALDAVVEERGASLLALDDALERLEQLHPRGSRVVVYRFFGGLTYEEIAQVMNLSVMTVRRAWSFARAWLHRELASSL